jgi:hypothetical protein
MDTCAAYFSFWIPNTLLNVDSLTDLLINGMAIDLPTVVILPPSESYKTLPIWHEGFLFYFARNFLHLFDAIGNKTWRTASPALFSDSTQRRLIVSYRRFGATYRLHLQQTSSVCLAAWPLMVGRIGCSETSVRNYQSALRRIRKERRTRSHGGRSLKSHVTFYPSVTAAEEWNGSQIWYSGILLTFVGIFRFLLRLDITNGHYLKTLPFVCSSLKIRSIFIETQKIFSAQVLQKDWQ